MILTPCRDATPDELPRTAATLLKAALAAGWTARATYAKAEVLAGDNKRAFVAGDRVTRDGAVGLVIDAHRSKASPKVLSLGVLVDGTNALDEWPPDETTHTDVATAASVVESVAVRLRRHPLAAVGSWHGGKFHVAYVWTPWTTPAKVGARQLSKFVKGEL